MPFARAQSILKRWLPRRWFTVLYGLASRAYVIWQKMSDTFYYLGLSFFYLLTGDTRRRERIKAIRKVLPYTMVGRTGLLVTYDIVEEVDKKVIKGCFVECGVARGGCSALMAMVTNENKSGRKSWLFDSFEGLPEQTAEDEYQEPIIDNPKDRSASLVAKGYCLGTFEEVEELLFSRMGFSRDNIYMVKGWFQDTLSQSKDKVGDIAILRVDADWYESTKCCLENFYGNVVSGGYVIIDDYGSVIGCKKATDEFIQNRKLDVKLGFDGRGGCNFVKP